VRPLGVHQRPRQHPGVRGDQVAVVDQRVRLDVPHAGAGEPHPGLALAVRAEPLHLTVLPQHHQVARAGDGHVDDLVPERSDRAQQPGLLAGVVEHDQLAVETARVGTGEVPAELQHLDVVGGELEVEQLAAVGSDDDQAVAHVQAVIGARVLGDPVPVVAGVVLDPVQVGLVVQPDLDREVQLLQVPDEQVALLVGHGLLAGPVGAEPLDEVVGEAGPDLDQVERGRVDHDQFQVAVVDVQPVPPHADAPVDDRRRLLVREVVALLAQVLRVQGVEQPQRGQAPLGDRALVVLGVDEVPGDRDRVDGRRRLRVPARSDEPEVLVQQV
jgi:hypothetical protein